MELNSHIFQYARVRNALSHLHLWSVSAVGLSIGVVGALVYGIALLSESVAVIPFTLHPQPVFGGIALIAGVLGISGLQMSAFLHHKDDAVAQNQPDESPKFTVETAQILVKIRSQSRHSFTQELIHFLSRLNYVRELFSRLGIRVDSLSLPHHEKGWEHEQTSVIAESDHIASAHRHVLIRASDLAAACFLAHPLLTQWYQQHELSREDVVRLSEWIEHRKSESERQKRFWSLERLLKRPPIGLHWIYGFTPVLSHASEELTAWDRFPETGKIVGRKREIEQLETALCKSTDANVLLIGPVGVGKETVIEGCAERIRNGVSPLLGNRIFEISGEVFSQMNEREALTLAREASYAGNIILAIPNIHLMEMNEDSPQGKLLQELSASNRVHILGSSDPHHYHVFLERNALFLQSFTKIEIGEPSLDETRKIIEEAIPEFEFRHGVFFTFSAIESVLRDSSVYAPNKPFPEKAIDALESIGVRAQSRNLTFITSEEVDQAFADMFQVPAMQVGNNERNILLNLEDLMHQRIVGQDAAVTAVARSLQRIRSGIERSNKPIGSFLFLGPTGVGKTETAKTLAHAYFGSEFNMLRFDMSEYQTGEGVDRFIGSVQTNTPGLFVSKVRDNPFSVILLDEIEKAYHDLLNLFLQVLDEGFLTDAFGDKVSFTQSIIIATSNAGSEFIRELSSEEQNNSSLRGLPKQSPVLNQNAERASERIIEHILHQQLFSPELINRFDSVIVFHHLTRNELFKVAALQLQSLVVQLKDKGFLFESTQELLEKIVEIGYNPQFGARPMARAIQNTVETLIAQKILSGAIQKGVPFTVSSEEITQLSS